MSICFTTTINQIVTNFKNFKFTSDVVVHAIVTCLSVFALVPAFADHFGLLVQHIVPSINSGLQLFVFKQIRHRFVLALHGCYCPKIFHTIAGCFLKHYFSRVYLIVAYQFCGFVLEWIWWLEYLVSNFDFDMP